MTEPMTAEDARETALQQEGFLCDSAVSVSINYSADDLAAISATLRSYADMLDRQTVDRDSIPMPQSVDYARKMHCLADAYLKAHDPEYKSAQTVDRDGLADFWSREYFASPITDLSAGYREEIYALIDRILALMPVSVVARELEWTPAAGHFAGRCWVADTPFGDYHIFQSEEDDRFRWTSLVRVHSTDDGDRSSFDTLDAAQAAVWAEHCRLVRLCLADAASGNGDAA